MEVDTTTLIDYAYGLLNSETTQLVRNELEKDELLMLEYRGIVKLLRAYPKKDIYEVIADFSTNDTMPQSSAKKRQIEKGDFVALLLDIVNSFLPNETLAFKVSGRILIEELFAGRETEEEIIAGVLNFSEKPGKSVLYIDVVNATYHFLFREDAKARQLERESPQFRWERLLREYGIPASLANDISRNYITKIYGSI